MLSELWFEGQKAINCTIYKFDISQSSIAAKKREGNNFAANALFRSQGK